jgi:hypothetical protein
LPAHRAARRARQFAGQCAYDPLFGLGARCGRHLFNRLPEIVAEGGDATVKLRERRIVRHRRGSDLVFPAMR